MEPHISIIMPLYNAERFLEETLVSISKQTFRDYELICVNDGSDDNTVDIVQGFQTKDSRVKLLNNEKHSGAAVARNLGIKTARAKYLIFLDGDDIFDEDMLLLSFNKAEEQDADIVVFEHIHVVSKNIYEKQVINRSMEYFNRFCVKTISVDDIKVCDFLTWTSAPWNKLFKKEFINHNHLEFQNIPSDNDTYFVDMAFFLAERIIFLDSPKVMVYARDHFTPSRISTERDPMCLYYAMIKVKEELKRRDIFHSVYKIFNYRAFYYMITGLKNAKSNKIREAFFDFLVNKGFDNLLEAYGKEFGIDQFLKDKKNKFINLRLREDWEEIDSIYEVFLEENLEEISKVFKECQRDRLRVGVWGVGKQGKGFIDFCNNKHLKIDSVIDKDEEKHGQVYGGYHIESPEKVAGIDVVISTPGGNIYVSVKEMVQSYNKNAKVIDLNSAIGFY